MISEMQDAAGDHTSHASRRKAILGCARAAFVAEGFAGAKIEPIAREAGVSTATLYALFASKGDLFSAVIEDAAEDFTREMATVRATGGDARTRLTSFAMAYAGFMSDPFIRSIFRLVMAERPRFQATALRFFEKGRAEFGATLIEIIVDEGAKGALRSPLKASWAAGQLMGMIEHPVFFVPLVTGDEIRVSRSLETVAADAIETFMARYGV